MDSKKETAPTKAPTKKETKQPEAPKRGRVIKNKTFKRRTDKREAS